MNEDIRRVYKTVYCLRTPNLNSSEQNVTTIERKNGFITIGICNNNVRHVAYFRRIKSEAAERIELYKNIQQNNNTNISIINTRTFLRGKRRRRKRKKISWPVETIKKLLETTNKLNEKVLSIFKVHFVKQKTLFKDRFGQIKGKWEKEESTVEGTANCEEGLLEGDVSAEKRYEEVLLGVNEKSEREILQDPINEEKYFTLESTVENITPDTNKSEGNISKEDIIEECNKDKKEGEVISSQTDDHTASIERNEAEQKENNKEEGVNEEIVKEKQFRVIKSLEELNFTTVNNRGYTKRRKLRKKKKLKHYCCRYVSDDEDDALTVFPKYGNEQNQISMTPWNDQSTYLYQQYENMFSSNKYPELNDMHFIYRPNVIDNFNNFNNVNLIRHLQDISKAGNVDSINMGTNFNRAMFFEASSKLANSESLQNVYNQNKFMYANAMQCVALNNRRLLEVNQTMNQHMQNNGVFNWWAQYNKLQNDDMDTNTIEDIPAVPNQDSCQLISFEKSSIKGVQEANMELQNIRYYHVTTVSKKTKKKKLRKVSLIQLCEEPHFFISEKFLSETESYLALNHCLMYVQKNQEKLVKIHDNFFSTMINIDDVMFLGQHVSTSILRLTMNRLKSLFHIPIDNMDALEFCLYVKEKQEDLQNTQPFHFREHNMYRYSIIIFLNTKTSSFIDFPNKGIKIMLILGNCLIYECNEINSSNPFKFHVAEDKIFFLKLNFTNDLQMHALFTISKEKENDTVQSDFVKEEENMNNHIISDNAQSNSSNNNSNNNSNTNKHTTNTITTYTRNDNNSTTAELSKQLKLEDTSNGQITQSVNTNSSYSFSNTGINKFNKQFATMGNNSQELIQNSIDQINNSFRLLNMDSMQKLLSNSIDHTKHIHSTMIQNYWNQQQNFTTDQFSPKK